MNLLHELYGLFVDDEMLAIGAVAVVVLAGLAVMVLPAVPLVAGAILLVGSIVVRVASVLRRARRKP